MCCDILSNVANWSWENSSYVLKKKPFVLKLYPVCTKGHFKLKWCEFTFYVLFRRSHVNMQALNVI